MVSPPGAAKGGHAGTLRAIGGGAGGRVQPAERVSA